MRILYQSLSSEENATNYWRFLRDFSNRITEPETTVEVVGTKVGRVDDYRFFEFLDTNSVLDNCLKAQKEGYDAVAIGNILDPGLREARQMLDIPVLALGEASILISHMLGQTFSLIAVNEYFIPRVQENIAKYGLGNNLVSIDTMKFTVPNLDKAFTDPEFREKALAEFYEGARKTIKKGAEVVIPAGGRLMALLAAAGVYQVDGVVVLNGITTLLKLTEVAVKWKALMGTFVSRKRLYAKPPEEIVNKVRQVYAQTYNLPNLVP